MIDKFGFKESHSLMDGRLAICTIAVGFAMFALVWDYLRPFPESRPVLITCVLSYPLEGGHYLCTCRISEIIVLRNCRFFTVHCNSDEDKASRLLNFFQAQLS